MDFPIESVPGNDQGIGSSHPVMASNIPKLYSQNNQIKSSSGNSAVGSDKGQKGRMRRSTVRVGVNSKANVPPPVSIRKYLDFLQKLFEIQPGQKSF
jgi:hypothetical protein